MTENMKMTPISVVFKNKAPNKAEEAYKKRKQTYYKLAHILKSDTVAAAEFWAEWSEATGTLLSSDSRTKEKGKELLKDAELRRKDAYRLRKEQK